MGKNPKKVNSLRNIVKTVWKSMWKRKVFKKTSQKSYNNKMKKNPRTLWKKYAIKNKVKIYSFQKAHISPIA
jgi:hypothetical protein